MKAWTNISKDGILVAALSENDLERITEFIGDFKFPVLIVGTVFT